VYGVPGTNSGEFSNNASISAEQIGSMTSQEAGDSTSSHFLRFVGKVP
jgi:hypothetical protein